MGKANFLTIPAGPRFRLAGTRCSWRIPSSVWVAERGEDEKGELLGHAVVYGVVCSVLESRPKDGKPGEVVAIDPIYTDLDPETF